MRVIANRLGEQMSERDKLMGNASNDSNYEEQPRLKQLKHTKFLTYRVFQRISENMSYEIFKYVNSQDLLQIRASTLGGFQLLTNTTLRARIKNYLKDKIVSLTDLFANKEKINFLLEQKGERLLSLKSLEAKGIRNFTQNFKFISNLHSLNLGNIILCEIDYCRIQLYSG